MNVSTPGIHDHSSSRFLLAFGRWRPRLFWLALTSLLYCLSVAVSPAVAVSDWKKTIDDVENDIVVYVRWLDDGMPEFRGVTHVDSTLSGCVALIRDVDSMPEWVSRTIKARVLSRISDTEVIAYNISQVGWPFENRDAIIHTTLEQNSKTLAITIHGLSLPDYDGPTDFDFRADENRYTRMSDVRSSWKFIPQSDGRIEVIFQGTGNPGGSTAIPLIRWAMRMAISDSPHQTLKGMLRIIGRKRYQQARFNFITDLGEGDR